MNLTTAIVLSQIGGIRPNRRAAVLKAASDWPLREMLAWLDAERRWDESALVGQAQRAIEAGARTGLDAIGWGDPRYPALLAEIHDPPPVLWIRGSADAVCQATLVAIVGSRAATPYALEVAAALARDLARAGVTVVSGLARGVDSSAHRGALDAPGRTIAILGCGADVVYPREHDALAEQICASGAVLSELSPGAPPLQHHFPARNRLISGVSRAVIVVEASDSSGSLITARCALEQGREVLAVPGNVLSGRNRGAHSLLKDGAAPVEDAGDVLAALGIFSKDVPAEQSPRTRDSGGSSGDSGPVLANMQRGEVYDLDYLSTAARLPAASVLKELTELELQGVVRRTAGGRFVRSDRSC